MDVLHLNVHVSQQQALCPHLVSYVNLLDNGVFAVQALTVSSFIPGLVGAQLSPLSLTS